MFAEIAAEIAEARGTAGAGAGAAGVDADASREQKMAALASSEPNLDLAIVAKKIEITHQNLDTCVLNFFEMDVELLFSSNPFLKGDSSSTKFSVLAPNKSVLVALNAGSGSGASKAGPGVTTVDLPAEFHNSNVYVQVTDRKNLGLTRSQVYFANSMVVQLIESYGQVKVTAKADGRPIVRAYVKVFCKLNNGTTGFYKDGYTDLRGRFDYVSLSSSKLDSVTNFSLLVLSDAHGAAICEAAPPKR